MTATPSLGKAANHSQCEQIIMCFINLYSCSYSVSHDAWSFNVWFWGPLFGEIKSFLGFDLAECVSI